MPCYLFTFHAYRSWMPDRPQGYVRRGEGALPPDDKQARWYERHASQAAVLFDQDIQRALIGAAPEAAAHQDFRLHCIATESTHVHVLVSWKDDRTWRRIRTGVKQSMTRTLNRTLGPRAGLPAATEGEEAERRKWFSSGASRKRVRDREDFDYLINEYLPSHRGAFWREHQ
jgi:REP element-mobilizing transposase RayT